MSINSLPSEIITHIYSFLLDDPQAKSHFKSTCHNIKKCMEKDEKFVLLAQLIAEKYTVCGGSHTTQPLWKQLKTVKAILVGECHAVASHWENFVQIAERLWEKDIWIVLTEGKKKTELEGSEKTELKEEILKASDTWDVECDLLFDYVNSLLLMNLELTSAYINWRDAPYDEFLSQIQNFLDVLQKNKIDIDPHIEGDINSLQKFAAFFNESIFFEMCCKKYRSFIETQIGLAIRELIQKNFNEVFEIVKENSAKRNLIMAAKTIRFIHSGKRVLVNAGSNHVKSGENSPQETFKKYQVSFLALLPKDPQQQGEIIITQTEEINMRQLFKDFNLKDSVDPHDLHSYTSFKPEDVILEEILSSNEQLKQALEYLAKK